MPVPGALPAPSRPESTDWTFSSSKRAAAFSRESSIPIPKEKRSTPPFRKAKPDHFPSKRWRRLQTSRRWRSISTLSKRWRTNAASLFTSTKEILLGGHIRILQGALPRIGEVDEDGVDRLTILTQEIDAGCGVTLKQAMSFPMKHVIACIGTQGPAPIFTQIGLQQITCTEGVLKLPQKHEGPRLIASEHGPSSFWNWPIRRCGHPDPGPCACLRWSYAGKRPPSPDRAPRQRWRQPHP